MLRWVTAGAVAVVATGVVVGGVLLSAEPDLEESMNRRAVAALERAQPVETGAPAAHGGHGGHAEPADPNRRTDLDGHELRCVARVFGHEPPDATDLGEVTVLYAHRMCAVVGPGLVWPDSVRETGPVAVRLGTPDTLVLPEKALADDADAQYADRVRAVIPKRYHDEALAFADFVDPEVAEELEDRVAD